MGIIEDALADFVVNHFEGRFEEVEELKDDLRDLRTSVEDLDEKVDKLIEEVREEREEREKQEAQEEEEEQEKEQEQEEEQLSPADEEETKQSRVSARTLKSIRKKFDLTQQELADLLDVSSGSITSWESGNTKPRESNKAKIVSLREKSKKEVEQMLDREEEDAESGPDIRSIRDELGLTQKEFAEKLDVSPTTVYNWEQGQTTPGSDKLEQIQNLDEQDDSGDEDDGSDDSFTGEDVRELREEKDLSQSELAEELDVSPGTVSNWERGENNPGKSAVEKLREL